MELTILERDDGITQVAFRGRLDTNAAEHIANRFHDATVGKNRPAIVDLSQVDFMASRGIGLLIASSKRLVKAGHKLVVLNPQAIVAGVLKTSKADLLMPIVHDLDEAIRVLRGDRTESSGVTVPTAVAPQVSPVPPRSPLSSAVPAPGTLKLDIQNELAELERLNTAVAEYLAAHAVAARAAYAVNLATEELLVNVIRYAYVDDETHTIAIELGIEGDQLVLTIIDDGMPFDPRKGPALNIHAEDYEGGGMGLMLVLDMVDALKYRREGERNRVEVRIHLAPEGVDSPSVEVAKS